MAFLENIDLTDRVTADNTLVANEGKTYRILAVTRDGPDNVLVQLGVIRLADDDDVAAMVLPLVNKGLDEGYTTATINDDIVVVM